jgi:type I restriction enzyme R subunit
LAAYQELNCRKIPITLTDLNTRRFGHDQALAKVMQHLLKDDTQVYKQFVENESFKRFVGDMVYALTSQ